MSQRTKEQVFRDKVDLLATTIAATPERVVYSVADVNAVNRYARKKPLPEIGRTFGHLTVHGYVLTEANGILGAIVGCSCGSDKYIVDVYSLRLGRSNSCNVCARNKAAVTRKKYHGYANIVPDDAHRARLLNRIASCIQRCHNEKDAGYPNYGGRGIRVYEDWRSGTEGRRKFLTYLVTLDGWDVPEYELDRVDCDKGYEPGNLRFITRKENMLNKRSVQDMQQRLMDQADYIAELEAKIFDLENMLTGRFSDE